ncbi:hypothetical protein, partial [Dendronalium sp. ChiSLP03b]|uniref:hypothetical protein n=1 Tax=Dendronalium sp. ChiSLP03b TaxID=3075381 RepID=UPI00391BB23C
GFVNTIETSVLTVRTLINLSVNQSHSTLFLSFITGGAPPVGLLSRNNAGGRGQKAEAKRI